MKFSWDYERQIEQLTAELNSYRFESGANREKIRREIAADCVHIARLNGARATAEQIEYRYGLVGRKTA